MSSYDVLVSVEGSLLDQCSVALPLSITHGRSGVSVQPDAPTAEFTYLGATAPGAVGDTITIARPAADSATWNDDRVSWVDSEFTWTGTRDTVPKFVGKISEIHAHETDGAVDRWEVRAIGRQGALGRIPVLLIRPIETDIERIQAIADAVGYNLNIVGTSDMLLAPDTINTNALAALHQVATSCAGLVWQGRAGNLWYGTANHRELPVENVIDCQLILDGVQWDNDQENIVNQITVRWGQESLSENVTSIWNYRPGIPAADPGAGNMHLEVVDGAMSVHRLNDDGVDMAPVMRGAPVGTTIYMQQKDNADNYLRGQTDQPITDQGDYFEVGFTVIEAAGDSLTVNNDVIVKFGAGTKEEATYRDDDSDDEWGLRALETDSLLLDDTQAAQLGLLILGRRAQPYWRMPGVLADYGDASITQAARLDALEVSEGITIPVEVSPTPTPGALTEWTVEGWAEQWATDGHLIQLSVSDRRRTGSTGIRNYAEMLAAGDYAYWAERSYLNALIKGVDES